MLIRYPVGLILGILLPGLAFFLPPLQLYVELIFSPGNDIIGNSIAESDMGKACNMMYSFNCVTPNRGHMYTGACPNIVSTMFRRRAHALSTGVMQVKRNRIFSRILAAVAVTGAMTASAAVEESNFSLNTTRDLYQLCSVNSDTENFVPAIYACRGFLEGSVQYHDAVTDRKNLKRLICYPSTATLVDGRKAFVAWAQKNMDNKELMGEMPVIGLVRALADKYPCGK